MEEEEEEEQRSDEAAAAIIAGPAESLHTPEMEKKGLKKTFLLICCGFSFKKLPGFS